MIEDCTALILAGGDSQRMGQDKAALVLNGKTLLESVISTMQSIFPTVIVSVRQPRDGLNVPQVCDEQVASGPLAGLIAGLAKVETPWVFAVACDMPFVMPEVIEQLASSRTKPLPASPLRPRSGQACQGRSIRSLPDKGGLGWVGVQAVVPVNDGYPQPLAAFYATSALEVMRASLAEGDKSLRGMLQKLEVLYVSEAELRACDPQLRSFFDLDTPQDFLAAQK
jgi:molybdopterin-guanine dinucleotide biosynthesis protein A